MSRNELIGVCPECGSTNIRPRRNRHRTLLWRCRRCNAVFPTPRRTMRFIEMGWKGGLADTVPPGGSYVPARRIPRIERRKRLPVRRRRASGRALWFVIGGLLAAFIFMAVVWGRNADTQNDIAQTLAPVLDRSDAPTAVPTSHLRANLRNLSEKEYLLEKINLERTKEGVPIISLGDNVVAQLHAESALENCYASHWGIDGLKPYMRYSLAGGYQSNAENGHGSDYCITASDNYVSIGDIEEEIDEAMDGWMKSPGHRETLLNPTHRKVSIGLAWDEYNFKAYQHFEGDYITFEEMPSLEEGVLTLSATTRNGLKYSSEDDLLIQVYYDAAPYPLSRGQVARTYCYDGGVRVAAIDRPLLEGEYYVDSKTEPRTYKPCPNPYEFPHNAPAPRSHDEAHEFWLAAYKASQSEATDSSPTPWVNASEWQVREDGFTVKADLTDALSKYGVGVYTVVVWGTLNREKAVVSQYSIFHGVTPPAAYAEESNEQSESEESKTRR